MGILYDYVSALRSCEVCVLSCVTCVCLCVRELCLRETLLYIVHLRSSPHAPSASPLTPL